MSRENVEIVRQHIEAYAAGDAAGALKYVHPEVEVDISRIGLEAETFHGHAGMALGGAELPGRVSRLSL